MDGGAACVAANTRNREQHQVLEFADGFTPGHTIKLYFVILRSMANVLGRVVVGPVDRAGTAA
jgi:hypothetical protein